MKYPGLFLFMALGVALVVTGCTTGQLDRAILQRVVQDDEPAGVSEIAANEVALQRKPLATMDPVDLNEQSVLRLAQAHSRKLQDQRDQLVRAGLTLFGTERDFGPRLSGTAGYVFSSTDDEDRETASVQVGLSQKLPTGGEVEMTGDWTGDQTGGDAGGDASSRARFRIDQPLTKGAGYRSGWEAFTQARRDFRYALRTFSLDRQDTAISTMRSYYNLVQQKSVVENTRQNLAQFEFLRKRSEALFKVDRAPAIDVLRSQQQELTALNRLTEVQEGFTIAVGRFLADLGIPIETEVELMEGRPELREVTVSEPEALELALDRRLDLMTARDRVEDAERKLSIARQDRIPELNVYAEGTLQDGDEDASKDAYTGGVSLELPLDLRPERDAVKEAALALESARRAYEQQIDQVRLDVREAFSRLRTQRIAVDIQLKNIDIAERRTRNAMLQFRNGTLSNRDVIEAENELLSARNAWGQALVDYEIQRLGLLRNVGLMDLAVDGTMIELNPEEEQNDGMAQDQ